MSKTKNLFPVYVLSKGRYDNPITTKHLDWMGVDYKVIVEKQEYDLYKETFPKSKLLILPQKYINDLDKVHIFDDYEKTIHSSSCARNFAIEHSKAQGNTHHWCLDDNINGFLKFNNNEAYKIKSPIYFRWMEDFILQFKNVVMAMPEYDMFVVSKLKYKPLQFNSRIMSCQLINNDIPLRFRGLYNEDVDFSIRVLKMGLCTASFYMFTQRKMGTQSVKGGNTDKVYKKGTYNKTKLLAIEHPDVVKMVVRYGRVHHQVDYSKFKKQNKPILKDDFDKDKLNINKKIKLIKESD